MSHTCEKRVWLVSLPLRQFIRKHEVYLSDWKLHFIRFWPRMPLSDKISHLWKDNSMAVPDPSGQYRRDLGWKLTRSGKRAQHRFYLGRDKNNAQVSETRLEA